MFVVADASTDRVLARKRTREAAHRVAQRYRGLGRPVEVREVLATLVMARSGAGEGDE